MTTPCEFVRYTTREGKGPRGGRATLTTATCVDCGGKATIQGHRAGSPDTHRAREKLHRAGPCAAPFAPPWCDRLLFALAEHVGDRRTPPLAFFVEFVPEGGDPDVAVQRAWRECKRGGLMLRLLTAAGKASRWSMSQLLSDPFERTGRASAYGAVCVGALLVVIEGPSEQVAA